MTREPADKQHDKLTEKAFFGRRKTKSLTARKQKNMEELLPKLLVNISGQTPDNLNEMFETLKNSFQLEIGFGGGERLVDAARKNPDVGFIGVEPFINGMAKMLGEIENYNLQNIRLFDDDAIYLLDWLPDKCLEEVNLFYPDPWPKKRNWKRRFVNDDNLNRIWKVLKENGKFKFASDIDTYVNWTLREVKLNNKFKWTATNADSWKTPWENWCSTRYEKKAVNEGRVPCYLEFIASR